MENFRPPAMEEVKKQQEKSKLIIVSMIIFCFLGLLIGGYVASRHLTNYFNQLTEDSKYLLLKKYYEALVSGDISMQKKLAPQFVHGKEYHFLETEGEYQLYVFPDYQTNDNYLLFNIIDCSVQPNKLYLNEVIYFIDPESNKLMIKTITNLSEGHQIN